MRRLLRSAWVILVAVFLAFAIEAVSVGCGKSETAGPTPTPGPVAVCSFKNLPPGTPPVCHDANGNSVTCPNNYKTLPDCP